MQEAAAANLGTLTVRGHYLIRKIAHREENVTKFRIINTFVELSQPEAVVSSESYHLMNTRCIVSETRSMTAGDFRKIETDPQGFFTEFTTRFSKIANESANRICWIYRANLESNPISSSGCEYKIDDGSWPRVPTDVKAYVSHNLETIHPSHGLEKWLCEPEWPSFVPHEMLREARSATFHNRRSAYALAVASVECSVKYCISRLFPESHWLVMKAPTPPIAKIFNEYLHTIDRNKNAQILFPQKKGSGIYNMLEKIVKERNVILHTGSDIPEVETVQEVINFAQDFLYLMDWYSGIPNAMSRISEEARIKWFNDPPKA